MLAFVNVVSLNKYIIISCEVIAARCTLCNRNFIVTCGLAEVIFGIGMCDLIVSTEKLSHLPVPNELVLEPESWEVMEPSYWM